MKNHYFFEQIKDAESESSIATYAIDRLLVEARTNFQVLERQQLNHADVSRCQRNIEATYTIRVFAEFEGALRTYWKLGRRRNTKPVMEVLIDSISAYNSIPSDVVDYAHKVREYRNDLVHKNAPLMVFSIAETRGHLCAFLSNLPHEY